MRRRPMAAGEGLGTTWELLAVTRKLGKQLRTVGGLGGSGEECRQRCAPSMSWLMPRGAGKGSCCRRGWETWKRSDRRRCTLWRRPPQKVGGRAESGSLCSNSKRNFNFASPAGSACECCRSLHSGRRASAHNPTLECARHCYSRHASPPGSKHEKRHFRC